ncbi:hypothetical protein RhiirA5_5001 [Rhizophagus irregularis]|uniref:Uncharacterized protein n=1 Tax=Rhizophagus irregularis TaxID=588596 RepID=A0A2N0Q7P8_9GLOM|nr:hypothetical protein RhiirA5_5001 [Rhizophagus irregularis]
MFDEAHLIESKDCPKDLVISQENCFDRFLRRIIIVFINFEFFCVIRFLLFVMISSELFYRYGTCRP